jgi:hypothetical protein
MQKESICLRHIQCDVKLIIQIIVPDIAPAQSCCDSANFQKVVVNTDAQKNISSTMCKIWFVWCLVAQTNCCKSYEPGWCPSALFIGG